MTDEDRPVLLLVDDEPSIREPLEEYLGANGYKMRTAADAKEARAHLEAGDIDLVLLDIMMPGEDGLSLTRDLRANSRLPIILLTARAEDTDRIVGLEIGADDYVTKPFNPRELLARVRAVLRRAPGTDEPAARADASRFRIYSFILEIEGRRLLDPDGREVKLTGGEYELLLAFAERAGRVLNRDQLLDITQGREAHVFDRSIDNQVSRLRTIPRIPR